MKRSGFTLVEVLIGLAIVSVAMSIMVTTLAQARASAKNAVSIGQLHQISLAIGMYSSDYEDSFPYAAGNNRYSLAYKRGQPYRRFSAAEIVEAGPLTAKIESLYPRQDV